MITRHASTPIFPSIPILLALAFYAPPANALDLPPDGAPITGDATSSKKSIDLFESSAPPALQEMDLPADTRQQLIDAYRKADAQFTLLIRQPPPAGADTRKQRLLELSQHVLAEETRLLTADQLAELRRRQAAQRSVKTLDRLEASFKAIDTTPTQKQQAATILDSAKSELAHAGKIALGDVQRKLLALLADDQRRNLPRGPLSLPASALDLMSSTPSDPANLQLQASRVVQDLMLTEFEASLKRITLTQQQQADAQHILQTARADTAAGKNVVESVRSQLIALLTEDQRQAKAMDFLVRKGKASPQPPATRPAEFQVESKVRIMSLTDHPEMKSVGKTAVEVKLQVLQGGNSPTQYIMIGMDSVRQLFPKAAVGNEYAMTATAKLGKDDKYEWSSLKYELTVDTNPAQTRPQNTTRPAGGDF